VFYFNTEPRQTSRHEMK